LPEVEIPEHQRKAKQPISRKVPARQRISPFQERPQMRTGARNQSSGMIEP
jgi:hypothetical protein